MTAATKKPWDYLPPDWSVTLEPVEDPGAVHPTHPLTSRGGIQAMNAMLAADTIWRNLTKAQRELLLSSMAGFPVLPRADVKARMVARGLIAESLEPTEAGRFVVQWRLP